ncbi:MULTISPECIES: hypothetical protein [Bradyrhizobium]|uniref:hypothetical protein n=1 Tax=Bradyrhizobium TaxID=374 RepID=UPI0013E8D5AA|nr:MULTISPECIES: hypothetical protein [Bradyrhizobium]
MTEKQKTKLSDGDQIIFKLDGGKWTAHVKYSSGGISGRVVPFPSFDAAVAALKEDHPL